MLHRLITPLTATALLLALFACHKGKPELSPGESGGAFHQYAGTLEPDDGQWTRATKDFANTRYSALAQISTQNVSSLHVAWTFQRA